MSDNSSSSSSSSGFGFNGSHFTGGAAAGNDTFNSTFTGGASKKALYIAGYKIPGLVVPIVWFGALVIGMYLFSKIYRRKKQEEVLSTESWFGPHRQRDTYISLLSASPPVDDKLLQAALLSRAAEDVKRIWNLRERKPAMQALVQRGCLSETTATRFAAAEKELEAEITDVAVEANTFRVGWAQFIFQSASEIAQKDKIKDALEGIGKSKIDALRKLPDDARKEAMEAAQKIAIAQQQQQQQMQQHQQQQMMQMQAQMQMQQQQQQQAAALAGGTAAGGLPSGMSGMPVGGPALAAAMAAAGTSTPGGSGGASSNTSGASSPARAGGISTPRKGSLVEALQAGSTTPGSSPGAASAALPSSLSQGPPSSNGSASGSASKAPSATGSPAKSTPGKKKKGKKH